MNISIRDFKALFNRLNDGARYVHKLNYIQIGRPYIIRELEHVETKMGLALVATLNDHDNSIRMYLPKHFKMSVEDIKAINNSDEIISLVHN